MVASIIRFLFVHAAVAAIFSSGQRILTEGGGSSTGSSTRRTATKEKKNIQSFTNLQSLTELNYQIYPRRHSSESAVVEWGHSAIISALDAVVAEFGPQTSRGAFFEVETAPILADPIDGYTGIFPSHDGEESFPSLTAITTAPKIVLNNAEEVMGNMVVMTNAAGLSGVQMATIAKNSGAVALMVVNTIDETQDNPDFIYAMSCENDEECHYAEDYIDIPVIMVSLTSGNVLTTATTAGMDEKLEGEDYNPKIGLPDRIRLYAGGDRPFFEDVSHDKPVVYLIHNLLTAEECDNLIKSASKKVQPVNDTVANLLEGTDRKRSTEKDGGEIKNIDRTYLWKGMLKPFHEKAIDERIEQVTGFPQDYISDFQVNKHGISAYHAPHLDSLPGTSQTQMASIHVYLTDVVDGEDDSGGEIVFPLAYPPIKIIPKKGMAVVYHNTDESGAFDVSTLHAELPWKQGASSLTLAEHKWTAVKWIYADPIPKSRRVVIPLIAFPFGGKLPSCVTSMHNWLVEKYGPDKGSLYFDKITMMLPVAILLGLASLIPSLIKFWRGRQQEKHCQSEKESTGKNKDKQKKHELEKPKTRKKAEGKKD